MTAARLPGSREDVPLVTIRLAGVPEGKGRPRFARATGRAFTPAATRSYEAALRFAGQEAMGARTPIDGALAITIIAALPIPESRSKAWKTAAIAGTEHPTVRPDFDNLAKVVDALNQVVWIDDKQVVSALIVKIYSDRPALTIEVRAA
jgi:Holliday junction resolvase RusA-like endonuclease